MMIGEISSLQGIVQITKHSNLHYIVSTCVYIYITYAGGISLLISIPIDTIECFIKRQMACIFEAYC